MRRLTLPSLTLALCLTACGGDSSADLDGGVRVDAFVPPADSGPVPDDAQADAGSDAGTLPTALTEATETAQASLIVVDEAFAAVPVGVSSVGAEFLETDLTRVRLDAIVGEKGLIAIVGEKGIGTLSLPMEAAPVMVILHHLQLAIDSCVRVESAWTATTDPTIITLRDAMVALREDLTTLRAELLLHFRDRVAPTAGLGRADLEWGDLRHFHLTDDGVLLQVLIEADATAGDAALSFDCTTALIDLAITVHDDESGEVLLDVPGNGGLNVHSIPVRAEDPTLLRVRISSNVAVGRWQACTLQLNGHRYWRDDAIPVDLTTLSSLTTSWNDAMGNLDLELEAARSAGTLDDEGVTLAVQRFAAEASIETAIWRRGRAAIELEEHELAITSLRDVLAPLFVRLLATPQLSSTTWADSRTSLDTLRRTNETAIGVLTR